MAEEYIKKPPGGHFHMLGGGGGGYGDVPPARVYFLRTCVLSGYTFLPIFLVCVLSRMLFNLIVSYVFARGIQSQGFLIVFYVLSGLGPGSPGGTTPLILVSGQKAWNQSKKTYEVIGVTVMMG